MVAVNRCYKNSYLKTKLYETGILAFVPYFFLRSKGTMDDLTRIAINVNEDRDVGEVETYEISCKT